MTEPTWQDDAACHGVDVNVFFALDIGGIEHAKSICAGCTVRTECLEAALAEETDIRYIHGVTRRHVRTSTRRNKQQARRQAEIDARKAARRAYWRDHKRAKRAELRLIHGDGAA